MRARDLFEQAEIERGRRYHRPLYAVLAAQAALGLATLAALAFTRAGDALHGLVEGLPWPLETIAFAVLVLLALTLVRLPLAWWAGWVHERRWELATQPARGWAADRAKGLAVGTVLGGGALLGLVALARLAPSWWPLAGALAAAALVALLGFVAPVVLEPLFNRFEPLRDEALRADLLRLAEAAGTPVRDVLVADASRRTRKANAYVSGLGRTRRVVLFDTLLDADDPGAVRVVAAHELAHRREGDVVALTLLGMAAAAAGVVALWLALGERVADPRRLPHVLLLLTALELAAAPALAAFSRRLELRADRISLELTGDPAAFERAFRALAASNVADLEPPLPVRLLLGSHPTIPERIAAARRFATVPR